MKLITLKSKTFVVGSLLLLYFPFALSQDAAPNQDWKASQREYVLCASNKSDELLHTGGSATEIAEISANSCVVELNTFKKNFAAYLLPQLTGSSAKDMADNGAEKSTQETVVRTKAAVAERVLKQRAKTRPTN